MSESLPERSSSSQVDVCYSRLRELIVTCTILPGSRLTERELIAQLGIGRTPVREALLRLDQDRLVDTKPRSGYRVRPLTRKSIDDFFITWSAVAPLMTVLAFKNLVPAQREELSALQPANVAANNVELNTLIANKMFNIIAVAAASEPLQFIYNRFGPEMDRIFRIFFATEGGQAWLANQSRLKEFSGLTDPYEAGDRIRHALKLAHRSIIEQIDEKCIGGLAHFEIEAGSISIEC